MREEDDERLIMNDLKCFPAFYTFRCRKLKCIEIKGTLDLKWLKGSQISFKESPNKKL